MKQQNICVSKCALKLCSSPFFSIDFYYQHSLTGTFGFSDCKARLKESPLFSTPAKLRGASYIAFISPIITLWPPAGVIQSQNISVQIYCFTTGFWWQTNNTFEDRITSVLKSSLYWFNHNSTIHSVSLIVDNLITNGWRYSKVSVPWFHVTSWHC